VTVVLSRSPGDMQAAAVAQVEALPRLGARLSTDPQSADLIIDALVGYSIRGDPSGRAGELICWANDTSAPTLALDLPSGLDPTTGAPGTPTVTADATLTLALPKRGLYLEPSLVGDLYLGDIGVPAQAYRSLGLEVADPFGAGPVVWVPRDGLPAPQRDRR